jgi:hypothetical protein
MTPRTGKSFELHLQLLAPDIFFRGSRSKSFLFFLFSLSFILLSFFTSIILLRRCTVLYYVISLVETNVVVSCRG